MEAGFQFEWLSFITSSVRAWVPATILSFVDFVFEHDKSPCLRDVFALMQTNQSIHCKKSLWIQVCCNGHPFCSLGKRLEWLTRERTAFGFRFWKIPVHRREEGMVVGVAQSVLVGVSAQSQESSLKHSNLQRFIPCDILLLTGSHFLDYTTSPNGAMNLQQALKTWTSRDISDPKMASTMVISSSLCSSFTFYNWK